MPYNVTFVVYDSAYISDATLEELSEEYPNYWEECGEVPESFLLALAEDGALVDYIDTSFGSNLWDDIKVKPA